VSTLRLARELACLALGHADHEAHRCRTPSADLLSDLVVEVRELRQRVGDEPDEVAQHAAVVEVLLDLIVDPDEAEAEAHTLLGALAKAGWRLAPVPR
jgi:hypothetical protein